MSTSIEHVAPKLSTRIHSHAMGWLFWFIAAIFYGYEFIHRVVPSVITNDLRVAFNVNEYQLGMIGAMYFYAYALFQIPAGILIDRYGAKSCLIIASAVLTCGSFIFTFTTSSGFAITARFLIGAGSAFAFIGCLKMGSQWLSPKLFPFIVGLTNLFGTMGALFGGMPLSYFVESFGWQTTLLNLSFAGLIITALLFFLLHDKKIEKSVDEYQPSVLTRLKQVTSAGQSWIIAFYGALLVVPIITLPEMWGVEFLTIAYQIPATQAASITHTIFIGIAIGGPLIGLTASVIQSRIQFMTLATLMALFCLLAFIYGEAIPYTYLYILLFFYGLLTANMLICFTLISQQQPKWAEGTAIGFMNAIVMAMGGLAQHITGWVLENLRVQHDFVYLVEDYQLALTFLPICLVIAVLMILFIREPNV